jgi:hypothetical protein
MNHIQCVRFLPVLSSAQACSYTPAWARRNRSKLNRSGPNRPSPWIASGTAHLVTESTSLLCANISPLRGDATPHKPKRYILSLSGLVSTVYKYFSVTLNLFSCYGHQLDDCRNIAHSSLAVAPTGAPVCFTLTKALSILEFCKGVSALITRTTPFERKTGETHGSSG